MKTRFLTTVLVAALLHPLAAQGPEKPGPEHQKLAPAAGSWDVVLEVAGPDGKPTSSKGTSEIKLTLGGFWLVEDFNADFGGMPFQGHGQVGFDTKKGKFVGTWSESMSSYLMTMEGTLSADGKVLTMSGSGPSPDGKMVPHRMVWTWKDANTRVFELYATGADGKETKGLTITYTRRAPKSPNPATPGPSDRVK